MPGAGGNGARGLRQRLGSSVIVSKENVKSKYDLVDAILTKAQMSLRFGVFPCFIELFTLQILPTLCVQIQCFSLLIFN